MITHTQTKKVYKLDFHSSSMKKRGCSVVCMISNFQSKDFYNDISCSNLTGVTQLKSSGGLAENRTRDSYLPSMHVTTTPLAH